MSNVFVKQAILNGEKSLGLLDATDREAVNLMISAKEEEAYNKGVWSNSNERKVAGEIGCGSFLAVLIVLGAFFLSRPEGWPSCDLQHRETLYWTKKCQDQFGNEVNFRECFHASRVFYTANIGTWECEASSENASSFSCKQTDTLPKEF